MRKLTDQDTADLQRLARLVSQTGEAGSTAREAQTELWRTLSESGVTQEDIARQSGVTKMGVSLRLRAKS